MLRIGGLTIAFKVLDESLSFSSDQKRARKNEISKKISKKALSLA